MSAGQVRESCKRGKLHFPSSLSLWLLVDWSNTIVEWLKLSFQSCQDGPQQDTQGECRNGLPLGDWRGWGGAEVVVLAW